MTRQLTCKLIVQDTEQQRFHGETRFSLTMIYYLYNKHKHELGGKPTHFDMTQISFFKGTNIRLPRLIRYSDFGYVRTPENELVYIIQYTIWLGQWFITYRIHELNPRFVKPHQRLNCWDPYPKFDLADLWQCLLLNYSDKILKCFLGNDPSAHLQVRLMKSMTT